jgi:hypothetical protein
MKYARDFYRVFGNLINNDVGQGNEHQLPAAWNAEARAPQVGKIAKARASAIDRSGNSAGGFWIVTFYALADALQILGGWQRPPEYQDCKNR